MRKLSLVFIIFLLFIGGNAFASFTPTQSLMANSAAHGYTVTDRDTEIWGTYDSSYYGYIYDGAPATPKWSGWYLGTVDGNDSEADILALVQYYFDDPNYSITGIDKSDNPSGDLTVTWDDKKKSGKWETTGGSSGTEKVEFYVVKGGPKYALYYMNPAALSGYWSTTHLLNKGGNIPDLSHLTVTYAVSNDLPGTNPVPEPGTILLLGVGLIGVAGIGRRKFQK